MATASNNSTHLEDLTGNRSDFQTALYHHNVGSSCTQSPATH